MSCGGLRTRIARLNAQPAPAWVRLAQGGAVECSGFLCGRIVQPQSRAQASQTILYRSDDMTSRLVCAIGAVFLDTMRPIGAAMASGDCHLTSIVQVERSGLAALFAGDIAGQIQQ